MSEYNQRAYQAGQTAAFAKLGGMHKQVRLAILHSLDEITPILMRKITNKQDDHSKKRTKRKK